MNRRKQSRAVNKSLKRPIPQTTKNATLKPVSYPPIEIYEIKGTDGSRLEQVARQGERYAQKLGYYNRVPIDPSRNKYQPLLI